MWRTLQAGLRCAPLMCLRYEDHFIEDLRDLRARWRIVPAPPFPSGKENRNTTRPVDLS
jgi:ubiquinone biosynthesis protein COQ4